MQQNDKEILIQRGESVLPNAKLIPQVISLLDEGHTVTLRLGGNSMRPFLEDGRDTGLLKKAERVKRCDVVLAEVSKKRYVLHRIIRIEGNSVTLRGDGNIGVEHCTLNDVKAVALGFYRKGSKHLDSTSGAKWRIYSFLWCSLFPIRRYLLAFYRRIWIPLFGAV